MKNEATNGGFVCLIVLTGLVHFVLGWSAVSGFSSRPGRTPGTKLRLPGHVACATKIDHAESCDNAFLKTLHLLSLKWPDDDSLRYSRPVRELWQWKDICLGDGRDFFVPKPKTLSALNRYLMIQVPQIKECSVISNCARFEVVLVLHVERDGELSDDVGGELSRAVWAALAAQVQCYQQREKTIWMDQLSRLDHPGVICMDAEVKSGTSALRQISNYWNHIQGVECVSRHLNTIAAGMAKRPSRPGRPVPFRPFSSRDSHVMLQLKRIAEIVEGPSLKVLLNTALRCGKLARNPEKIPQVMILRAYGSGGGRYSQEPPVALSEAAASAVIELAIEPGVRECVDKYRTTNQSDMIIRLRKEVRLLARTDEEVKLAQRLLHRPTMDLRLGVPVDIHRVQHEIGARIREMRAD